MRYWLIIFVWLPILVFGQIDTTVNLDEIVIDQVRMSIPVSDLSHSIEIITRKEIESSTAQSINELIGNITGVDVRRRGPNGVQADLNIRASTFDQTLVLINGIKMSDPQTGHHTLNIPLSILDIERIEIIKGPAARSFGQNAFAGAINIVTKRSDQNKLTLSTGFGENGLWNAGANLQLKGKNLAQRIAVSSENSDGYKHNTDYNINNIWYENNFNISEWETKIMGGFVQKDFGANGFYASPDFTEQYEETQTSLLSLALKKVGNKTVWHPRVSWRRNQDEYVFIRNNPEVYRNLHISNTLSFELNTSTVSSLGTTGFGVEFRSEKLRSNNLGDHKRSIIGIQAEHIFTLKKWQIRPGILFNHYDDLGNTFFPGIDISYDLNANLNVYGNTGYTYRVPTYTDLYYSDQANVGNPLLEAESAFSYEVGLKYAHKRIFSNLAFFHRKGTDQIDWVKNEQTDPWKPENIATIKVSGVEISSLYRPYGSIVESIRIGYTYIESEAEDELRYNLSRYAFENLKNQFQFSIVHKIAKNLNHSFSIKYSDRLNLPDYWVNDNRVNFTLNQWMFHVSVNNTTNKLYKETNLVTMPGRWIQMGIRHTIKL